MAPGLTSSKSGWRGLTTRFRSSGLRTLGTAKARCSLRMAAPAFWLSAAVRRLSGSAMRASGISRSRIPKAGEFEASSIRARVSSIAREDVSLQ